MVLTDNIEGAESVQIHIDGASRGNPGNSGAGILIEEENGEIRRIKKPLGVATNNQAEYEALITALEASQVLKKKKLLIFTDSLLLANQINGSWRVRSSNIANLYKRAKHLIQTFDEVTVKHIPREENKEADKLANQAIDEYLVSNADSS